MIENEETIPVKIEESSQLTQENPFDALLNMYSTDDIADDGKLQALIDLHPDVREVTEELNIRRSSNNLDEKIEKELVESIRQARSNTEHHIKAKLGITEELPDEVERRKEIERLNALGIVFQSLKSDDTDEQLLIKYGLMNKDGQMTLESMKSPLFKSDTRNAFSQYLSYVQQFDALQEAEAIQGIAIKNIGEADRLRAQAHNIVADLVNRDCKFPFDVARRFVAKSRDAILPGSHEQATYAKLLRGQKLGDKYGHDALAMTEDTLKSIIDLPMAHELTEEDPKNED